MNYGKEIISYFCCCCMTSLRQNKRIKVFSLNVRANIQPGELRTKGKLKRKTINLNIGTLPLISCLFLRSKYPCANSLLFLLSSLKQEKNFFQNRCFALIFRYCVNVVHLAEQKQYKSRSRIDNQQYHYRRQ